MGKVIMSGIVPQLTVPAPPVTDIPASDIAVGSSVYLSESGTAVEYLVVNKGIPSGSSLYDSSCDGLWLLRKDIHSQRKWSSNGNLYASSDIHAWLNSTFLGLFDATTQAAIVQAKIPYVSVSDYSGKVLSGASGLSTKVFLPSICEVIPDVKNDGQTINRLDGAVYSYFSDGTRSKRIAYYNGSANTYHLRTPSYDESEEEGNPMELVFHIDARGYSNGNYYASESKGIRPALILPHTALFDAETLLFTG